MDGASATARAAVSIDDEAPKRRDDAGERILTEGA